MSPKLLRHLNDIPSELLGSVVTLGNFDGVHRGHQKVIETAVEKATARQLPLTLITFEPHPHHFFFRDQPFPRLTWFRDKWKILEKFDLEYVLCFHFNQWLAALSAEDFIYKILLNTFRVQEIVVGEGFLFGAHRSGNVSLLKKIGKKEGFEVTEVLPYSLDGERVSSTRIRTALQTDHLHHAARWLGRNYSVWGRVIPGEKKGRLLGFPTANISLARKTILVNGVYVVRCDYQEKSIWGVANVGVRPTLGGHQKLLEVHLLDFHHALYREYLKVEFLHKLREETCYETLDALKHQIAEDVRLARVWIATNFRPAP